MSKTLHEKPIWVRLEDMPAVSLGQEPQGEHTWAAHFFESGRLAYWQCSICDEKDRVIERLPERLDKISGWVTNPPQLVFCGLQPAASARKWEAVGGSILVEGDPSSIHFVGVAIPGLEEAHSYSHLDREGAVIEMFEPVREQPWPYRDHYWLIRYQVIENDLVRFQSHCYEDSTYEVPNASQPKLKVMLSNLRLLPGL